jgi:hypothetical protein
VKNAPRRRSGHALDHENIFEEDLFPLLGIARAQVGIGVRAGVVDVDMFLRPFRAARHQNDGKGMVAVHTEQDVREGGDIFRRGIPRKAQPIEIRETVPVLVGQLTIDQRALTRVLARLFDMVVIFEP